MPLAYLIDTGRFRLAVGRRVIRGGEMQPLRDANSLVQEASALADKIEREAERIHEIARERGFETGKQEAAVQCARQLAEIEAKAAAYVAAQQGRIVDMALRIVRHLACGQESAEVTADLVVRALGEVKNERFLVVRVHPDNHEAVVRRLEEKRDAFAVIEFFDVVADAREARYACTLESAAGIVKADLEQQIDAIEHALRSSSDDVGKA
jgi:type III secretion protein L